MPLRGTAVPTALALALVAGCAPPPSSGDNVVAAAPRRPAVAPASKVPVQKISYPATGSGTYAAAPKEFAGPRSGGEVLRYRVLVEQEINGIAVGEFAETVRSTLADPRGWTAGGDRSFRRVGRGAQADFTIYLVTPGTRDDLCQDDANGYTSCRNGEAVVINVARWVKGVPRYAPGLETYRQYVINHEVGHRLGYGHQLCPGKGEPAPVMQQQTLGMHGCKPHSWPYRDDELYTGAAGQYNDSAPPREGAAQP
ncbi:DUF3152 domain-containing protein [Actinoplanes sp. NPDC051859]|uniref:DUF3152 domain-containing protein n=1 Tax=Actinoplanes sp. NPDC051859 TaxID=3363909 RepID=UPI0037B75718